MNDNPILDRPGLSRPGYYTVLQMVVVPNPDRMSQRSQRYAEVGVNLHPGSRAQPLGIVEVVGPAWSHLPHFSSSHRRCPLVVVVAWEVHIGCIARLGEGMVGHMTSYDVLLLGSCERLGIAV
jgi:hypothetical protein